MGKKRQSAIKEQLEKLQREDVQSLTLFALYKMHDDPQYAALSELAYILDGKNLSKLLAYYGGMTIKIPTLAEMRLMVETLTLYQYVNLEGGDLEQALPVVCGTEFKPDQVLDAYTKICDIVGKTDFHREYPNV